MSRNGVTFNRLDALKYQSQMLAEIHEECESKLHQLQLEQVQCMEMQSAVRAAPEIWNNMTRVLRPLNQLNDLTKRVEFQQKLIKFCALKKQAVDMMIVNQKDPTVRLV